MNKIGLVFSGGGGKGAYEFGVWKAIRELQLEQMITGISGTSIGGLNGVLFAMRDYETCEKVWNYACVERKSEQLSSDAKLKLLSALKNKIDKNEIINEAQSAIDNWLHQGFLSTRKLTSLIKQEVDFNKLKDSDCDAYITCHDYIKNEAIYFHIKNEENPKKLAKILRATASIPIIFAPVLIDKHIYGDGGMSDNTPIKPLYENGFKKIIVIRLSKKEETDDQKMFPNAKIYTLYPKVDMGNFIDGSLNFYSEVIKDRINRGYEEGKAFLLANKEIFLDEDEIIKVN